MIAWLNKSDILRVMCARTANPLLSSTSVTIACLWPASITVSPSRDLSDCVLQCNRVVRQWVVCHPQCLIGADMSVNRFMTDRQRSRDMIELHCKLSRSATRVFLMWPDDLKGIATRLGSLLTEDLSLTRSITTQSRVTQNLLTV